MDQSFDINVLREESKTRWLKPSEVYYILQNHERFPITHESPKEPPSGSLFLYNRRVNRYFRRDGHAWRRKKDGRTVAEAHERLKVGNVDGLSCYYAHGEENPCFQRRCFWMLEPAYEHIVLVQYREVSEGRYYSSQLSNGPPESLSSLRHSNAIYGNQYHSSASGISEGSESHQSYSNLSSVTELSSYSENREYNKDGASLLSIPELGQTCLEQTTEVCRTDNGNSTNKSGLNLALKKLAEQLSLGDDDDDYLYSNQAQPLGSATNIEAAVKAATCIQTAFHTYMSTKRRQKTANYGDEYGTTRANSDEFKTTSRLQYHYNAVSIQLHDKAAALIQKRFRIWMQQKKFLGVKIQALLRAHQAKKQIYGNTAADELASARWSAKGTGYQDFRMPTSSSSSENQLGEYSELTKNFKRRKIGNDVCIISSREDTSDPRHLDSGSSLERVKVQYSTLYSDVKAWLAMGKQWEKRGLHHTCVQQAASQLHGTSDIKKLITEEILLNRNGGNNCTIICIISGSGLGKTTLLHVLYNDQQLLDAFDMRIWIQMSQRFDREMLFRKTIEFITHVQCRIANLNFLEEMTKETLTDKKFLLFLDDADIEDEHFWTNVLEVLNAGAKGSVIVIATSSSTVAALTGVATHSYRLGPLSEENNLMLLQQYAGDGYIKSSPELVTLAKKFVARFGANPLNLKAFGGLLYHADTVLLDLDKLGRKTVPCLQLCHDVLPKHLKNCLAFCSLFPKGYIFDKHHTVLLWLSRGFIVPVEGRELEDVGVEYFNELLYRSFFQYSPSHDYKEDKFVVHELIYNVVLSVSYDKYFKYEDLPSRVPENIRHVSLVYSQFQTVQLMPKTEELKDLQTFLVVQPEWHWQQYKISFPTLNLVGLDDFFLKFTSLETMDLSHTDIEELPGSIAGLRNLQYLSLNGTSIRALPSELCSLRNLQTLKAKDCRFLTELPGDTKELLKLRHLDVTKELGYVHLPHGVEQLTELRTLPVFHASGDSSHCSISELGGLHNLRGCLQLAGLESVKTGSMVQEANLKDKQHLQDLTLQWHDGGADIDADDDEEAENVAEQVLECLQPHANLQELCIRGYEGSVFPAWMQGSLSLPNLVSLTLDCCCNCTQFPAIAQLASLKFLSVRKMYDAQRLISDVHGATKFPSLELLNLWEMYGLEELFEMSEGDCPRLRKVCVSRCPDLKRLPCTPSLGELVLHCCHQFPDIPELASLVSLKIEGFHGVKSFSLTPAALPALKKLEIRCCNELSSVHGLAALTTVQRLKIAGCPKLLFCDESQ